MEINSKELVELLKRDVSHDELIDDEEFRVLFDDLKTEVYRELNFELPTDSGTKKIVRKIINKAIRGTLEKQLREIKEFEKATIRVIYNLNARLKILEQRSKK